MRIKDKMKNGIKKQAYSKSDSLIHKLRVVSANKYIYFMAALVMLWYLIFAYVPMYGITMAFRKFRPGGFLDYIIGGEWVGFEYFKQIFMDPLFYRAVKNTLIISGMKLLVLFPFVIFLVLMLNELKFKKFKKLTQTIMYLPHFFSWVVIGGIVIQLLSTNGGAIANLLTKISGEQVNLLTDNRFFRWVLVFSNGFKEMGWDTIIYLSAIAGIPMELYEAASIDGAGRARKMISITLPSMLPTIVTMLLIKISFMIVGDFDQVYMMYNSAVYDSVDIIDTYLYRIGLTSGKFGLATAMGLFKSVISVVLLAISNMISRKVTGEGIF